MSTTRLSRPLDTMAAHYDAVVVGSGYGGGVAASRLARAGKRVALLERGPERQPGEFPDTLLESQAAMQMTVGGRHVGDAGGLFDFHVDDDIVVLTGCGLGGTSLINANVSLRADARVFDHDAWPAALRADTDGLEAGYARAEAMLRPTPYPASQPPLKKYEALERSAKRLGLPVYRTPINVTFEDGINHVGVEQKACTLCGDCVSGCNHRAKNTTLMNYLPDAVNHGAALFTSVAVHHLSRHAEGGWIVHFMPVGVGRERFDAPPMTVRADVVVLGAGALGSSGILLRSREAGLSLSPQVGARFTGNGDVIGFAYNADQVINGIGRGTRPVEPGDEPGPCITGVIDGRGTPNVEDGFVIEEGVVPGAIGGLNPLMYATAGPFIGKDTTHGNSAQEAVRTMQSLLGGAYKGATDRAQTFLVMSHDDAGGRVELDDGKVRVRWPDVGKQPHFARMDEQLHQASAGVGATYYRNPLWTSMLGDRLITVHPLGGAPMGEDATRGAINHKGQVFSGATGDAVYDDLYVACGAALPRSVGVNPLLTITAIAERNMATLCADRGWHLDVSLPSRPAVALAPATPSLEFTETMRGWWAPATGEAGDGQDAFTTAAKAGKAAQHDFAFTLTIDADDARRLIDVPPHEAAMFGTVVAPALSAEPLTVTQGVFHLFEDDPDTPDERRMRYRMTMRAPSGRAWFMDGYKRVRPRSLLHAWGDTSTLYITIHDGADATAPVMGRGVLRIEPRDFQRQMTTMRVTNAANNRERLELLYGFGKLFAGVLYETYGGIFGQTSPFREEVKEPRKRRSLALPAPEVHHIMAADGTTLQLTRFEGGSKGPVIVAPGFGMAVGAYLLDTIEQNLTEALVEAGYDVWLFDYRTSPALPSASQPTTIDEVARYDWPAAVARVREVTGAESVQAMGHCVGSLTLLMAQLAGLTGVRSMICSALTAHPRAPLLTDIKAGLRLPSLLTSMGVEKLSTDVNQPRWFDKALDQVMRVFPTKERCHLPVCRRILFMYGEVFEHAQLNRETHEMLDELFGVAHMQPFAQLAAMTREGHIVDADGNDTYTPHVARLSLPITFLHGADNNMFQPEGSLKTLEWLQQHNNPVLYTREVIPDYAHLDTFIGRNVHRDVFPRIIAALDRHAMPAGTSAAAHPGAPAGAPVPPARTLETR